MRFNTLARHALRHASDNARETVFLVTGVDLTRPRSIQAVVNERCNYRCLYCDFWRLPVYQPELSIAQWQQTLSSLREFLGHYVVQFAGGEPFIKQDFIALPEYCARHAIDWGVITNGSVMTPALAERVVAAAPLNIDISVDSADTTIHDRARGVRGSLLHIQRNIDKLVSARSKQNRHFPIRLKATVHRLNAASLAELPRWASEIGADSVDFSVVKPWTAEVGRDLWLDTPAQLAQLQSSVEKLIALKRQGLPIENSEAQLQPMLAHFRRETVDTGISRCRLGLRDFHIRPNGDVVSCGLYPPIGNVTTASAASIWNQATSRATRRQMTDCDKLGQPGCGNLCLASQQPFAQQLRRGWLLLQQVSRQS